MGRLPQGCYEHAVRFSRRPRRPRPAPRVIALAALAALAAPRAAAASACCGVGHGMGERLGLFERARASIGLRFQERLGAHLADGGYAPLASGDHERELRAEIGWLVRLTRRAELGASLPALITLRGLGGRAAAAGGIGDLTVHGRYALVPLGEDGFPPPLALTLAALVPTGRPARAARDPLGADVTGLGVAELRPGLAIERTWDSSLWATASASLAFRTPTTLPDGRAVHLAPRARIVAAAGPVFDDGLSLALGVTHEREAAPRVDDDRARPPGGERRRTAATIFAAYDLDPRWTVTGAAELDVPVATLGMAESAHAAVTLGLRHAWREHD